MSEQAGRHDRRGVAGWAAPASVVAVVAGAAAFLPSQTLWLDEATQMSGLRLGPVAVARWLAGWDRPPLGQFPDRMPPLSYWVGWSWSRAFGPGEAAMRWLGVLEVAGAAALISGAARRAFGNAAAWVAGLLFALSPAVLVLAVEIRAYPLLLLFSAAAVFSLTLWETAPGPSRAAVAGLTLALMGAVFSHFFGLVLAGAVLVALVVGRRSARAVGVVAAGVAVAALGIAPFLRRAIATAGGRGPDLGVLERLRPVVRLIPGLTSNPAMSVVAAAEAATRVAVPVLLALAAVRPGASRRARAAVGTALGAGLMAVAAGALVAPGFDAARGIYNAWMWPAWAVLLASGLGSEDRRARRAAAVAAAVLLASLGVGAVQLGRHGRTFAHGPHRAIARLVRDLGPGEVTVVHDDATDHLVFVSCPLRYEFGADLRQYQRLPRPGGGPARLRAHAGAFPGLAGPGGVADLPGSFVLVIRSWPTSPRALFEYARRGDPPAPPRDPACPDLLASPAWRLVRREVVVAQDSVSIDLFRRVGPDGARIAVRGPLGSVTQ